MRICSTCCSCGCFVLVVNVLTVSAMITLEINDGNGTRKNHTYLSQDASFGGNLPDNGLWGRFCFVTPEDACTSVIPAPVNHTHPVKWIAVIKRTRDNCTFSAKVLNVQKSNYSGAIIYDPAISGLMDMGPDKLSWAVKIPAVFVGCLTANELKKHNVSHDPRDPLVGLYPGDNGDYTGWFLLPFVVVVGLCLITMVTFLIVRCALDQYRKRKTRLSSSNLKKLPIRKFKKGSESDVCAVCLEEYVEGDKLRVLPCDHEYHQKCIDPWLTKNKKTCPLCKRKVFPDDSDSDSDTRSAPSTPQSSEHSPLLSPATGAASRNEPRRGRNYGVTATTVRPRETDNDSSNSDDNGQTPLVRSQQESSVEVHARPQPTCVKSSSINGEASRRSLRGRSNCGARVQRGSNVRSDRAAAHTDPVCDNSNAPNDTTTNDSMVVSNEEEGGAVGGAIVIKSHGREKKKSSRRQHIVEPRALDNVMIDVDTEPLLESANRGVAEDVGAVEVHEGKKLRREKEKKLGNAKDNRESHRKSDKKTNVHRQAADVTQDEEVTVVGAQPHALCRDRIDVDDADDVDDDDHRFNAVV